MTQGEGHFFSSLGGVEGAAGISKRISKRKLMRRKRDQRAEEKMRRQAEQREELLQMGARSCEARAVLSA